MVSSNNDEAQYITFTPSRAFRFWNRLGFKYAYVPLPEDENCKYVMHHFVTKWDWIDRLRILISGKAEIQACFIYECPVLFHSLIKVDATVLPPPAHTGKGW